MKAVTNAGGLQVGDYVQIIGVQRTWASDRGETCGFVVGTTREFVYVALGDLFGEDHTIVKKRNYNVSWTTR